MNSRGMGALGNSGRRAGSVNCAKVLSLPCATAAPSNACLAVESSPLQCLLRSLGQIVAYVSPALARCCCVTRLSIRSAHLDQMNPLSTRECGATPDQFGSGHLTTSRKSGQQHSRCEQKQLPCACLPFHISLCTGLGNFLETEAKSCSENSSHHFGDNSHQTTPRPELCLQRDRIQTPEPTVDGNPRQLCVGTTTSGTGSSTSSSRLRDPSSHLCRNRNLQHPHLADWD